MDDFFNQRWLTCIAKQNTNRKKMFGNSLDCRADQAKKQEKKLKETLFHTACDMDFLLSKPLQQERNTANPIAPPQPSNTVSLYSFPEEYKDTQARKQKKKRKKHKKKAQQILSDNLFESNAQKGNLMAEIIKGISDIIIVENELYMYQEEFGHYKACSTLDISREIHSILDFDNQLKIASRQYKESYEQLLLSDELTHKDGFFSNAPFVNCLNGVVDVRKGILLEHSPDYFFKHCIQANFLPGEGKPKQFLDYAEFITSGDKELKNLLRVIMGYIFSHYNNAKKAFLLYAKPHTGKSVLCALIERILGTEYICHVDLSMLQKQEYAASLSGKLLNVAPDLKNDILSDVGFFKSLVSHNDTISARSLYNNPKDIHCEAKMLFSSNHLLTFDSSLDLLDIEAVFNRLLYFPFQNKPISDQEDNKHLSDMLFEERDLIFTWAMKGLREYVENNETFPKSKLSEDIKQTNMSRYCPEKVFFQKYIKKAPGKYESSSVIKEAFSEYCHINGINKKADISQFLEDHQKITKTKKRIDVNGNTTSAGNPIYVYKDIQLKTKKGIY